MRRCSRLSPPSSYIAQFVRPAVPVFSRTRADHAFIQLFFNTVERLISAGPQPAVINTSLYPQISRSRYRGRGRYPTRVALPDCGDGSNRESLDPSRQSIYLRAHGLCTRAPPPPPPLSVWPTRGQDRDAPRRLSAACQPRTYP